MQNKLCMYKGIVWSILVLKYEIIILYSCISNIKLIWCISVCGGIDRGSEADGNDGAETQDHLGH